MTWDPSHLFTLRVQLFKRSHDARLIVIHAFDGGPEPYPSHHHRIDVEVRHDGKVIFPRGATWCAIPGGTCIDGIEARELVMSLVAMRPGDTDSDYFTSYTSAQLAFAEEYGEALGCEREARYCDENGNVTRKA